MFGRLLALDVATPERSHRSELRAEVRDAAGASNYLLACKPAVVCGGTCWDGVPLGSTVTRVHGTVRHSSIAGSGGYRISMSN